MSTIRRHGSRRGLTRALGAALGLVLAGGLLAACAPPAGHSKQTQASGTVKLGIVGNTKDELYPYSSQSTVSGAAIWQQMYNGLTELGTDGSIKMALAKSMTPNDDNTVWTIHLRPNVKMHDGGTFDADDLIYSVKKIMDPKAAYPPSTEIDMVDPDKIEKVDDLTVKMTLNRPYGPFAAAWSSPRLVMIGADWTKDDPDGTGPFTLDSFAPGQQASFTKFDGYWGKKPGFTHLKINFFQDQGAITNALKGHQIDLAYSVPFTEIGTLEKMPGMKVLDSDSAGYELLEMRTDVKPFDDPKVREAFRLIVNRKQIVDNAFNGYAKVANDYLGNNSGCQPPDLPQRKQDIPKAKKLLAEAGATDIHIDLPTDGAFPGMLETAQLFAQQAKKAGVTVNVRKLDGATFLNKWLEWPFLVGYSSNPYLTIATNHFLPGGEENSTHFDDKEYIALAKKLYQSTDEADQCKYINKMHTIEWKRGGDIVPVYSKQLTVHWNNVHGLHEDLYGRTAYLFDGVTVS